MNEETRSALSAALREASAATQDCPDLFERVVAAVRRRRRRRRLAVAAVGAATAVGLIAAVPSAGLGSPPHSRVAATPAPSDASPEPAATSSTCAAGGTHVLNSSSGAFGAVRHYWGARVEPAVTCLSHDEFHAPL